MYTSGWPKSQNRFWYRSGSPPFDGRKNVVPKLRSKNTMISATVMIGMAKSVRNAVTSIIQTNTGMRMSVMPGARMLRMVTMKLMAEVVDAMPSITIPTAQKSGPRPGRAPSASGVLVSGRVAEPAAVRGAAEQEARVEEDRRRSTNTQ